MRYVVRIGPHAFDVDLADGVAHVDGERVSADLASLDGTPVRHLLADGAAYRVLARPGASAGRWRLWLGARALHAVVADERTVAMEAMIGRVGRERGPEPVRAPMPGMVVRVLVNPGQVVEAGAPVVTIEAMKMQNELKATTPGKIARVLVRPGQAVESGTVLVELEASERERGSTMEDERGGKDEAPAGDVGKAEEDGFSTAGGIPVERVYSPENTSFDHDTDLGAPGEFPFTRGVHPTMYRGRPWTMRQYAGFGTAEQTNRRYRYLLEHGQTGLSVAFDLPTQMGYDSDHVAATGEVGRVGVAIDSIEDMRALFEGIPLDQVSVSMTINATAPILLAMYVALADERGIPRSRLAGTVQNDILKEYIARGTYIYPVEPSLRLVTDVFAFCAAEVPRWNTISISGYHIREAGATAVQEVAFTLANALEYVNRAISRGLTLESFAPRLSFFFAAHTDLFEEAAKFRAARRLWARLLRDRYNAPDEACRLRFHTQTGGVTLTAQQPLNNVVRVTVQALAAILGGTQSLHTNAYDEALSLPTEASAKLALRTQQILAHESGVRNTVDPLGGSYYVESLTDAVEERAAAYLARVDELGGAARAIPFFKAEIERAAYVHQLSIERGERVVVGVNTLREPERPFRLDRPDYRAMESAQRARTREVRRRRDGRAVAAALTRLRETAAGSENLLPAMIDAVKVGVTLGEISDALRRAWGEYQGVAA